MQEAAHLGCIKSCSAPVWARIDCIKSRDQQSNTAEGWYKQRQQEQRRAQDSGDSSIGTYGTSHRNRT